MQERSRSGAQSRRDARPWTTRISHDIWFADRNGGLTRGELHMLGILECYCRRRDSCWVGNGALARAYGGKIKPDGSVAQGAAKKVLREMEAAGLLLRVAPRGGGKGRLGIILFRRLDPDLPVADPDHVEGAVARLVAARESRRRPEGGRKVDPARVQKMTPVRGQECDPGIRTDSPKEDKGEETTLTFARAPGRGGDPESGVEPATPPAIPASASRPYRPVTSPEARDHPESGPARVDGATTVPGPQAPPPGHEGDAIPTVGEIAAHLEVANGPRRDARERFASATARRWLIERGQLSEWPRPVPAPEPVPPAETPRLGSWPSAVGPVETDALIRRVASPGAGPEAVEAAAARVADRLHDTHSLPYYRKAFSRVQSGEVPLGLALSAWKLARSGTARCPGSVFVSRLKGKGGAR